MDAKWCILVSNYWGKGVEDRGKGVPLVGYCLHSHTTKLLLQEHQRGKIKLEKGVVFTKMFSQRMPATRKLCKNCNGTETLIDNQG